MIHILTGDIGGTKTRLSLFEAAADGFLLLREAEYTSTGYASLEGVIEAFMPVDTADQVFACFGVAGPVRDGKCKTTNLAWTIDSAMLRSRLNFVTVALINDLEATAWGLPLLESDDIEMIYPGRPHHEGNRSVVAAGTGLGEAGMYWDGTIHRAFASEGSHADFSARTEFDFALLQYLQKRHGHVSWERVVSGPGLVDLFEFLCAYRNKGLPDWYREVKGTGKEAPSISNAGLDSRDGLAVEALDLFVHYYGAEAGNHALKLMATGGVYIGGGIAPKIIAKLREPAFMEAFLDKGRMRALLESMPVNVVLNDRAALYGPLAYLWHNGYLAHSVSTPLTLHKSRA